MFHTRSNAPRHRTNPFTSITEAGHDRDHFRSLLFAECLRNRPSSSTGSGGLKR